MEIKMFGHYYRMFKGTGGIPTKVTVVGIEGDIVTLVRGHLTKEDFDRIYTYSRTHLSHTVPGEFTTKNSLMQMQPYSRLARRWIRIGKLAARLMYFPKSVKDPEVRMMLEGILEGNVDSVCNQSGGMVKRKTILKIVDSANRGKKHE